MQIRRSLIVTAAVALAGCGVDTPADVTGGDPAPTEAAAADPVAELAAAARALNGTTMRISQTSPGTTSTGSLDPKRRLGDMDMRISAGGREARVRPDHDPVHRLRRRRHRRAAAGRCRRHRARGGGEAPDQRLSPVGT